MRLPRDINGAELIRLLRSFGGYEVSRQTGSHVRLTTQRCGEHPITVPFHSPVRVGTLSAILGDVAGHFMMTREQVIQQLFK